MANNSQSLPLSLHFRSSLPRRRSSASLVLTKMKINLYFFIAFLIFRLFEISPRKSRISFQRNTKKWQRDAKIQMNPAIDKKKKKIPTFFGWPNRNFSQETQHNNQWAKPTTKILKIQYFGHSKFSQEIKIFYPNKH